MKGIVFTELLEFVDDRFSLQATEELIEMSDLPSGCIYTSVGTYDALEMQTLVSNLSKVTGVAVSVALKEFGKYLFSRFFTSFPHFFSGVNSTLAFLPHVENFIHLEVCKLYPDAELPSFSFPPSAPGTLIMIYRSKRNLPDLAEGLILGCIEHFGDNLQVSRSTSLQEGGATQFIISPK